MPRPTLLTETEVEAALASLVGWTVQEATLHKTFTFADFSEAWGWMSRVALLAEKINHHPDWSNVYRTVIVKLSTHDAGGLTRLDIELATRMDALAAT